MGRSPAESWRWRADPGGKTQGKRLPQVPSSAWQGAQIKAAWLGQAAPEVHVAVVDPTSHQLPHPPTA